MGDRSEGPGPTRPGPPGIGPEGPLGQLLRRHRSPSPTRGGQEPRRVRRRVLVQQEEEVVSGSPSGPRGDRSEGPGPTRPGPPGIGPEGPLGQLLRRHRSPSPTRGGQEPRRVRRRVLVQQEEEVVSGSPSGPRGDRSEGPGPTRPGPPGIGPEGPLGQLLRRHRSPSPTRGGQEPRRVRRRVLVQQEEEVVSGSPSGPRGDRSEGPGPTRPGPPGIGPEGPLGQLLRRHRSPSPTRGGQEPRRVRRRVLVQQEEEVVSGSPSGPRGDRSEGPGPTRPGPPGIGPEGPLGQLLRRHRSPSPTRGGQEPRRVRRRVLVQQEEEVVSGSPSGPRGDRSEGPGPTRPGPPGIGPEGPLGQLLRRHRSPSPTRGGQEPRRVRRRVLVQQEEEVVSGSPSGPRGDRSEGPGPTRPGPPGIGPEGPLGQLLRRHRSPSPTRGGQEPRRVRRRVLVQQEEEVVSGSPSGPLRPRPRPPARSLREWLLRIRDHFEPPTVTTQRQSVYIEEEEDED
ncbi:nuclear antigen EBNA-LP [Human gammaherpesvirus 4]|uniref:Epstein-Barr nuclear antigen leader protein n=5 Tax=Epstein-Barr virus (strain GD1) TaxID=10376 RepID=EBNA5_EBVB9|nr:nuclear antigen EBNA-LP [human gammaherpesvirus 4]P0C732.1 RecName: Full=Epstein-Barr nuclear antigen leader protein; Short=EBNA-LP; Short=EBV nuclear antigen leader protein; AltName: Full=Epstein-Barr nuclear antigen 5; Short=EBNA-5; Short=EBV nuclear antigen 5 [human gammaherpesvirus 4]Q8AZK7.1 RecName: Full=Epstein-Barr nuclear antigen leader protein; Short=EBNA-LP; Short=EBV nuclear antigen leader protein; AltName: Full=Epstein-Barr nuclear antigen 5; Short=EBNA-5; Short=EBV nuclear antige